MDNSVKTTIDKIKLQEQDNEMRLREQRELSSAVISLNRTIHEASLNIDKLNKEYECLITTTDKLQHQLIVEITRKNAVEEQVNKCRKELQELQNNSFNGVSSIWEKRSKLFATVHNISDKCDIRALLIKPKFEVKPSGIPIPKTEETIIDDTKLKTAIERKKKAIALRDYLLAEPDVGEEFVRTRNALQYSIEIMAQEQ